MAILPASISGASAGGASRETSRLLIRLDDRTGMPVWKLEQDATTGGSVRVLFARRGFVVAEESRCASDDRIYEAGDKAIVAYSTVSGKERWRANDAARPANFNSGWSDAYYQQSAGSIMPTIDARSRDTVRGIELKSGRVRWEASAEGTAPAAMNSRTILMKAPVDFPPPEETQIRAMSRGNGAWKWAHTVSDGYVVWGTAMNETVVALLLWQPAPRGPQVPTATRVELLDAKSGAVIRDLAVEVAMPSAQIQVAGSTLAVSDDTSTEALDLNAGTTTWRTEQTVSRLAPPTRDLIFTRRTTAPDRTITAHQAIDGETAWSVAVGGGFGGLDADSRTVAISMERLIGVDTHSGRELWSRRYPDNSTSPVVAAGRAVYISGGCSVSADE